jgi:hypothetical protein
MGHSAPQAMSKMSSKMLDSRIALGTRYDERVAHIAACAKDMLRTMDAIVQDYREEANSTIDEANRTINNLEDEVASLQPHQIKNRTMMLSNNFLKNGVF